MEIRNQLTAAIQITKVECPHLAFMCQCLQQDLNLMTDSELKPLIDSPSTFHALLVLAGRCIELNMTYGTADIEHALSVTQYRLQSGTRH
ncbi:hypothetical protein VA249_45080 (plasmid) [Vibrio alfacsensis]|uniref:hypothetical protein n=1 Tax=Vibrio sp. 04Ya108 TaxID=864336 RepID=UPI00159ECED1|nr:hypothetical protein [Vibrio sp. 04Ya108]BBM67862.1 hypothetical protein VA249_45080 [Vibrio alfacsensis]